MDMLILGAKSALAVLLLVAAGAKLADLPGFASAVGLFVPRPASWAVLRPASWPVLRPASWPVLRSVALVIALAELVLGAASLSSPAARWLNPVVFAVCCAFVAVSGAGYAFHRRRSCRCFGALSQRKFDAAGIARSVLAAAAAAFAMAPVQPSSVQLTATSRLLLLAAAAMLAFVAFTAAKVLALSRETQSAPTRPAPTQPAQTQPAQTQPAQTQQRLASP
jgi:hypothetical protein